MRILLEDRKTEQQYIAELHGIASQPPKRIRDLKAEGRIVKLNGRYTPFFFGESPRGQRQGNSRVNFELGGIWFHITGSPGHSNNLFEDLQDWNNSFDFVTDDQPMQV